jgi:hypothetical protein
MAHAASNGIGVFDFISPAVPRPHPGSQRSRSRSAELREAADASL